VADRTDSLDAMPELDLQRSTAADGRDLLAAAEADWSRPIPHCPAGDAADRNDLAAWYLAPLDRILDILSRADPETPTWTFSSSGDLGVAWWRRRLAVELAIHRWDAQHAASLHGAPAPRPPGRRYRGRRHRGVHDRVLPRLLAQDAVDGLTGTLHLHANDGPSEWWIDLDARADAVAVAVAGQAKADAALRGTRSDLLLWLANRDRAKALEVLGRAAVSARWAQLRR
jgi:hypothetical protein